MKTSTQRLLGLAEPLAFSAFIAWYIWQLQATFYFSWFIFPVWMVASFLAHGDTPKTMGWRADNLGPATKRAAIVFGACIAGLLLAGILLGAPNRPVPHLIVPGHFFAYVAFCLLQQVALNSYLTNRVLGAGSSPVAGALLVGTIFAALHWPNPVLVPLTLVGGIALAWLFARERNIIPLAVGQGILGTLVWWAFPVAWHHGLRVGPGFYSFHPR